MRVVATAGHVDHGKSTLVLALTGTDPDRFAEEKARGLTIDLGFAFTTLPSGTDVGFVDVPGHVRFVKNMLAGVGAVEIALLVVAANEGWMPQTAEHVAILELLDIRAGLVAVTKADLVDAETLELAQLELADHLEATPLAGWPVVTVDAVSGRGLDELRAVARLGAGARARPARHRASTRVDRPGLLGTRIRHRRDRHAHGRRVGGRPRGRRGAGHACGARAAHRVARRTTRPRRARESRRAQPRRHRARSRAPR